MATFFTTDTWIKSLRRLKLDYGKKHRAVLQAQSINFLILDGDPDPFATVKKTKRGESRIPKCVKYDLYDFFRLVTIQDGNAITLLYVGNHDKEEKWLEQNKGLVVGKNKGVLVKTKVSDRIPEKTLTGGHDVWTGKLLDRLDANIKSQLIGDLSYTQLQPILDLESGSSNLTIEKSIELINADKLKKTLSDVLILLNQGDVESAESRAGVYFGTFESISELTDDELIEINAGAKIQRVPIGSAAYRRWVESFLNSKKTYEWFLFMHPQQEKFVQEDYGGPAKLSGVSGSGKTAIAIARGLRLARKYSDEKILIVTLNKALADLISEVVSEACSESIVRQRIDVLSYFDLATNLVHELEPQNKNLYTDITIGLEEHKDEIYREFYRCMNNNYDASILKETHFHLVSQNINAENYISEEFDWIRSTRFKDERHEYLDIDRKGRSFPLVRSHREKILIALKAWEQKMLDVGVIDSLGLTTVLSKHLNQIEPKYRSIIVDEAQDFGTTELTIIRKLTQPKENDIFLCGDAAQQVQPKRQNFSRSGINVSGRSFSLKKNYRNSKEILKVAYDILVNNLSEEHIENSELEISDPEFAVRTSPEPILLQCNDLEEEIAYAVQLMHENADVAEEKEENHSGCIAVAGYTQFEIEEFAKKVKLNVLNGSQKRFDDNVFISDLEQTKGYEFDTVVIVNCNDGVLPPVGVPTQELYRFVSQFYVAMTRAKSQLVLSVSGSPSTWLQNDNLKIDLSNWDEFIDPQDIRIIGKPSFLPDFPGEIYTEIGELTGDQFIFTNHAAGMSPETLAKVCSTASEAGSPFIDTTNNYPNVKNVKNLFESLTSTDKNGVKNLFREDEARSFASVYMSAGLNVETHSEHISSKPIEIKVPETVRVKSKAKNTKNTFDEELIQEKVRDLRSLAIPASTYAILFSLKIRTLEDVVKVDSSILKSHLSAAKITRIKKLAKQQLKDNAKKYGVTASKIQTSVRISDAGFTPNTLSMLKKIQVKFIEDLGKLSIKDFQKNPRFGNKNFLEIQRIAKSFGVKFPSD